MAWFECMDFTDWTQVTTAIVTTIAAVVVAITSVVMAALAYKTYLKGPEQEPEPEKEIAAADQPEELTEALVFKTSKQETKLLVTPKGLECHLDDKREGKGGHQWTISKVEAQQILDLNVFYVNPGYKANTGTFSIGKRKNWLYSKNLYPEPEYLHGVLGQLLKKSIS